MFNLFNIFSFTLACVLALTNHASADAEDCVLPLPPKNGFLKIDGVFYARHESDDDDESFTIEHMERMYFSCDADYEISGMKSFSCVNGRFRYEVPLCVKSICGPPPTVENGQVAKAIYKARKLYPVSCSEGYRFKAGYPKFVVCRRNGTDLGWHTKLPVCEKIPDCGDPGFPKSGHRLGDSFLVGQSLTFSCEEQLELIGEQTITCQDSGQWDFPRPRCKPNLSCPDPPNSPSTIYKCPNQKSDYFVPGDRVEISCDEGYTLEGKTDSVLCYLDEDDLDYPEFEVEPTWNNAFPTCTNYSRCGVPVYEEKVRGPNDPEIMEQNFGGTVVKTYWPWMVMLQNNNNTRKKFIGYCGGSLINQDWILTAARCINPWPNETLNATKIRVLLGFTHDNDSSHVQAATPVRIFMHEKFNISDKSKPFDYDVALLKLEHSVKYEKRIRPVCLSPPDKDIPENSTLYHEMTTGWLIGYGNSNAPEKANERFLNLKEIALNVGRNHDCSEGLVATKTDYTDQMFCAGGELDKNFCGGDGGSPFMKHQYHPDGSGYWIQTGIASFIPSSECGVEGEYGYYTKLSSVRKWIDNIIQKN